MVTMRYGKWFWYMVFVGGFSYLFAEVGVLGSGEDGVDFGELALIDFWGAVLFFGASIALTILSRSKVTSEPFRLMIFMIFSFSLRGRATPVVQFPSACDCRPLPHRKKRRATRHASVGPVSCV